MSIPGDLLIKCPDVDYTGIILPYHFVNICQPQRPKDRGLGPTFLPIQRQWERANNLFPRPEEWGLRKGVVKSF